MTEEELKAIKHLKNYKYDNEVRQSIDIILNLIEKQQKEIENSVSKEKIRELIEELEDVLDLAEYDKTFAKYKKEALKEEINDLKELLGE